jgi:Plasmid replication region DNA-binding N-term
MGREGVKKEKVGDAVFALRAARKPVTTRTVRLEVGTGSNTTISRFLEELGAKSGAKPSDLPNVPEKLQRQFANALYSIWEASSKAASERSDATEAQCAERIHTLSKQLALEREERKRAEMELCSTQAELAACTLREQQLREEVSMLRQTLGVEKALNARAQRERASMLKALSSRSARAASRDEAPAVVAGKGPRSARAPHRDGGRRLSARAGREAKLETTNRI